MGIKGLTKLLTCYQRTHPYLKYRTKIIAIDVNILIYKFCDLYHNSISFFLQCFVFKICSFLKFGIHPVFIFDGNAPVEKQEIIKKRFNTKRKYQEKLELMQKNENTSSVTNTYMKRLQRQAFMVTKEHRTSLIQLLECMNLSYFVAEGEAEVLCALLQKAGQIDYTLSEDTDTIAYGCTRTIRMFHNCERYLIETDINQFLKAKLLTRDQFLTACVLSGCDYLNKSSNVSLDQCITYVKKYHTLERSLKELKKKCFMHTLEEYKHIKNMYQFQTACTTRIIQQQKQNGNEISKKMTSVGKYIENDLKDHFIAHNISLTTAKSLLVYIKESMNEFILIRHNFFSPYTRKKNACNS